MKAPHVPDVGWQRRYRETELAAAALFAAAVLAAVHGRLGWAVAPASIGVILMLVHRERRLQRTDGGVSLIACWWLLGAWRVRRSLVQAARVEVTVPDGGWFARRQTLLVLDTVNGALVLERWRHPSERVYALQFAAGLARWFGVRLTGVLAPFDARPVSLASSAALRATLVTLTGVPGSPESRVAVPYRVTGHAPILRLVAGVWTALVGAGLLWMSTLTASASGLDRFALGAALPMGALLVCQGLAWAFAGRIHAEVGPAGLYVERRGLRPEIILRIPFANVTWVGPSADPTKRPTLRVGCGDAFADLSARRLELAPAAFATFCSAVRQSLADWLDGQLVGDSFARSPEQQRPAPPRGPVCLDDQRAAPSSALLILAQAAPRLSTLATGAFTVALFLVARGPAGALTHAPHHLRFVFPSVLPFGAVKLAATLGGAGAFAAMFALVARMFLAAPENGWHYALLIPLISVPLVLIIMGGIEGMELVDCWNICAGTAQVAHHRITVDGEALQYGSYDYVTPTVRRDSRAVWLKNFAEIKGLLEVDGFWGGRYLVAPSAYHATCDVWRAHLPASLPKETSE